MSAINAFAFQNILCVPQTRCACRGAFAEEATPLQRELVVTARWMLETGQDGTRCLVRQWFTSDRQTAEAGNHRQR